MSKTETLTHVAWSNSLVMRLQFGSWKVWLWGNCLVLRQ